MNIPIEYNAHIRQGSPQHKYKQTRIRELNLYFYKINFPNAEINELRLNNPHPRNPPH